MSPQGSRNAGFGGDQQLGDQQFQSSTIDHAHRQYKYYDLIMAGFVIVLLCSGIIGVQKVSMVAGIPFGTAILFFPLSYLFGDILTEVYGYARSRRVIWAGFAGLIFAAFMSYVVVILPPAPGLAAPGGLRSDLRQHPAGGHRLADRLLGRRVHQLICPRADEGSDQRALALDADDRIDDLRRGGRFAHLLSACLLWRRWLVDAR
jgi:hypothetical protein